MEPSTLFNSSVSLALATTDELSMGPHCSACCKPVSASGEKVTSATDQKGKYLGKWVRFIRGNIREHFAHTDCLSNQYERVLISKSALESQSWQPSIHYSSGDHATIVDFSVPKTRKIQLSVAQSRKNKPEIKNEIKTMLENETIHQEGVRPPLLESCLASPADYKRTCLKSKNKDILVSFDDSSTNWVTATFTSVCQIKYFIDSDIDATPIKQEITNYMNKPAMSRNQLSHQYMQEALTSGVREKYAYLQTIKGIEEPLAEIGKILVSAEKNATDYNCLFGLAKKIRSSAQENKDIAVIYKQALELAGNFYLDLAKQLPSIHKPKTIDILRECARWEIEGSEEKLRNAQSL